jgi:hypothetical protein
MGARRSDGRYLLCAAFLSVVLAELGHQLGFVERYGSQGFALEGVGIHQYFPTLMSVVGAGLGGVTLAVLLVLSLGRLAVGGALGQTRHQGVPVRRLLPVLLALQLAVYLTQETSEALASSQLVTTPWVVSTVAWGLAAQVPIALLAGLALSWLSARLDHAITAIREVARTAPTFSPAPVDEPKTGYGSYSAPRLSLASDCRTALAKRGPPQLLRPLPVG